MIWHVVRFDFEGVAEDERRAIEDALAGLTSIPEVAWLRVARDADQPTVTGLLTAFRDLDGLATYRTHPDHVPVVERIRDAGVAAARFDIEVDDDVAALPS